MKFLKVAWFSSPSVLSTLIKDFRYISNPTLLDIGKSRQRIFVSTRNKHNQSSIAYFDICLASLRQKNKASLLLRVEDYPNSFFRDGIGLGGVYEQNGTTIFGFMAWQKVPNEHWRGEIGTFSVNDNLTEVQDVSVEPQISIDQQTNPISLSYPAYYQRPDELRIWYGSTIAWDAGNGEMHHVIKSAEYEGDGHWCDHKQCISSSLVGYQAFSRPSVISLDDRYLMAYSCREAGAKYVIKFSISDDLKIWKQKRIPIFGQTAGQDDEMQCYPFLFRHDDEVYMLYNGNHYGKSGVGLAKLLREEE